MVLCMIYINESLSSIDFLDKNNRPHRENGPAVICGDYKEWRLYGALHRLDGPAIINGYKKMWYIKGKEYNETEYHKKLKEMGVVI